MRILITGAAGFIGSHLAEALERQHHQVFGFDNFLTGRTENWSAAEEIDITDRAETYQYANSVRPDLVIHCAASYSDPDKWHRDTQINVEGGINAALIARHHNAHLIYFQTILPPISSYAISKIAAQQYMKTSGVPLTVFRLANIYGPRNRSGPIPVFYKRLTSGQPCVVVDTTREMVFIEDLVRCVQQAISEQRIGEFDVCTGHPTTISDLFYAVANELGSDVVPPVIPPDPDDVQGVVVPHRGIPGWMPTTPLQVGIARTIASYRESGVEQTFTHLRIGEKDAS